MLDLSTIARAINDREEAIAILKKQSLERAADALSEVILQGADLLRVKSSLRHGQWLPWLSANCSRISARTANDYMRLASNPQRAADLLSSGSIRQALALLEEHTEEEAKKGSRWPPYIEAMGRLSKLIGYVERFPVEQWPSEGLEKFREDLQPIAAKLWPEKFEASKS